MDDIEIEKKEGISWSYLADVPARQKEIGDKYWFSGWGIGAVLFSFVAKAIIEELGPEKGGTLLKKAVTGFGRARGQRVAKIVKDLGEPLTLKNFLVYGDIDPANFKPHADIVDKDLTLTYGKCGFWDSALQFGLTDFCKYSCMYHDYAMLEGYNPDIKMTKEFRHETGKNYCVARYIVEETNKQNCK